LQNFRAEASRIHYYVFDLLCWKGRDLTRLPLIERRALLKSLVVLKDKRIKTWDYVEAAPNDLLSAVREQRLEGIIGKQKDSHYQAGKRTGATRLSRECANCRSGSAKSRQRRYFTARSRFCLSDALYSVKSTPHLQGYFRAWRNGSAAVGMAVAQEANDYAQLMEAADRVEQRLQQKPRQMVADAGYTTPDNIELTAERTIDFLGTMAWDHVPSGTTTPNRLPPSAFVYDSGRDCFICPEGKLLSYDCRDTKKASVMQYRYSAGIEDCQDCARKPQCCPENKKRGRSVMRVEESTAVSAFREKMTGSEAQAQYHRRERVVEFCHAWIKE
jgi:hypothetical protein